jgi:hypothetical protein
MTGSGLVYEILIHERHLPAAIEFVDRHPHQLFVLDHLAKPPISEGKLDPWRTHLRELARREPVVCNVSGMVTEADWSRWTPADLRPYFEVALDAFGPRRLLAASDWPVCLLASRMRDGSRPWRISSANSPKANRILSWGRTRFRSTSSSTRQAEKAGRRRLVKALVIQGPGEGVLESIAEPGPANDPVRSKVRRTAV